MTLHTPSAPSYKRIAPPKAVGIIAAALSAGQRKSGVDTAPIVLNEHGLSTQLEQLGWQVKVNDMLQNCEPWRPEFDPDVGRIKEPRFVGAVNKALAEEVRQHCARGELALTLGGDHSLAVGTISGSTSVYGDELCVVWVDAHSDINSFESSPSGNLHGCPLAILLDLFSDKPLVGFEWVKPILKKERLVYIGLRDVDEGEKRILRENNIKAFSMYDVDKYGIGKVVEMALDHVNPARTLPIHLSFDVDALDPTVAPSTGTPVRGGLTFREGHFICEEIAATGQLVAMDLVEVNPSLGDKVALEQTVKIGCSLVRCALGETLL
ncbi:arginase [Syncephalis pseudoplumigaleata]|uniref:Arginase n=1 Tax=Syncephalis pseudoplumigaleata TaxID=1712513 RepID=A0A4P9Z027_9FUNG|nr:arginase [Syncephalis pseudoplumigaleata]|eukprot:RKP25724.1 arginase [Syncephalis pseudoplumigaleata]